jgi:3-methyladenine DNA glycosylase AlkD
MVANRKSHIVRSAQSAFRPLADTDHAAGAYAYMKGVAPFLGIKAADRRKALKRAWHESQALTSDDLGETALALMHLKEREFHYAAYDLIAWNNNVCDEDFLMRYGAKLLTTTPWWDTVDGLVNAMVSPLMYRFHNEELMDEWSESGDRWLIRAAIGHQRGWKIETNIKRVLELCERHWASREFFIAKAVGWALRDLARINPTAVERFLAETDTGNSVAIREANRGLQSNRT